MNIFYFSLIFYKLKRDIFVKIFTNHESWQIFALNIAKTFLFAKGFATIVMKFYIFGYFFKEKDICFLLKRNCGGINHFSFTGLYYYQMIKSIKKVRCQNNLRECRKNPTKVGSEFSDKFVHYWGKSHTISNRVKKNNMKEKMEMKKVNPHKRIIQILCRLKTIPLAVSIILCLSGERGGGLATLPKIRALSPIGKM
jgi:hypothetical protein